MNKLILCLFSLACVGVGVTIAGYGSGTPGYYDPWTYYGGYDRYYNTRYQRPGTFSAITRRTGNSLDSRPRSGSQSQPRPFNPSTRGQSGTQSQPRPFNPSTRGQSASASQSQPRPFNPVARYRSGASMGYNRISLDDDDTSYDEDDY